MVNEALSQDWPSEKQDALRSIIWKLNICGCGTGETWEIIKLLLQRAQKSQSFYDKAEDASSKWVEFAAKVLDAWDLLDHGTGIGGAWLTEEGKLMLKFLNDFGCDDDKWPDWAESELD